jgi:hypothetical protein
MQTFQEWLQENDPELYSEFFKEIGTGMRKAGLAAAAAAAIGGSGAHGFDASQSGLPPSSMQPQQASSPASMEQEFSLVQGRTYSKLDNKNYRWDDGVQAVRDGDEFKITYPDNVDVESRKFDDSLRKDAYGRAASHLFDFYRMSDALHQGIGYKVGYSFSAGPGNSINVKFSGRPNRTGQRNVQAPVFQPACDTNCTAQPAAEPSGGESAPTLGSRGEKPEPAIFPSPEQAPIQQGLESEPSRPGTPDPETTIRFKGGGSAFSPGPEEFRAATAAAKKPSPTQAGSAADRLAREKVARIKQMRDRAAKQAGAKFRDVPGQPGVQQRSFRTILPGR